MKVLVVNAGSSSLKYQIFDTTNMNVIAKGLCDRIGIDGSEIRLTTDSASIKKQVPIANHSEAMKLLVEILTTGEGKVIDSMAEIGAIGHRIVHGGTHFSKSALLTDEVYEKLVQCGELAPLHTPAHLQGIAACKEVMPSTPQVVVFDTAFHQTIPQHAYMYPIPYQMYKDYAIRRYGFHGTSHLYVSSIMCDILGKVEGTKIVTCHLGNGSSIAAVKDGKSVDTSMGFTPLAGVEMGTRCGDIDPAVVTFIMEKEGISADKIVDFLNKKCGFLGVSELSSDLREIFAEIENDGPKAEQCKLAVDLLSYQIKKYIGAYSAAMGGLDAVVFTAGIGENNPDIREIACTNMEYLGIKIDKAVNDKIDLSKGPVRISTVDSRTAVYVIPTNEELIIARDTRDIVAG